MKYDFITAPNRRNSGSSKWEGMKGLNPNVPEGVVPLSVADMELKNPPEIMGALRSIWTSRYWGIRVVRTVFMRLLNPGQGGAMDGRQSGNG